MSFTAFNERFDAAVKVPCPRLSELIDDEPPDDENALTALSVVLVEDDDDCRNLLVHILEYHGADVLATASAREALDILERHNADVLISDLRLPVLDGFALIRELRTRTDPAIASIPAASITASRRAEDRHRALAAGYQMHLQKPIDPEDLIDAVLRLA